MTLTKVNLVGEYNERLMCSKTSLVCNKNIRSVDSNNIVRVKFKVISLSFNIEGCNTKILII